jgi:NADPH:quinone reductase-like Zn-dependent oxidoreductase
VRALEAFGPHAVIDTRHEAYVDRVKEITGGAGARVIFDPVYGPLVNDHIRAACREAVVFVYGALDPTPLTLELGGMLRKQIRLQGYTIGPLLGDPARRTRGVADITARLQLGEFTPVVDSYFPLDRVQDAHRRLESNLQIGKVVVTPGA